MRSQISAEASATPGPSFTPSRAGVLQRKCACGGSPGLDGECADCRAKRLGLQRQVTNQVAVSSVPPSAHETLHTPGQPLDASTRAVMEPRFGHDFGQVRVHTDAPPGLQASLTVNQPGDAYEQEADRVAEQVMRMPEPRLQRQATPEEEDEEELLQTKPLVQRQEELEDEEEDEELLQTKPLLQRRVNDGIGTPSETPAIVHDVLRSPGQSLDPSTRAFMEPRFGHDFSQVRVHTDAKATRAAQAVNARAFTGGRDVVFGIGEYTPETAAGRRLLAHELTHVVQQSRNLVQTAITLSQPADPHEEEADRVAGHVMQGPATTSGQPASAPPEALQLAVNEPVASTIQCQVAESEAVIEIDREDLMFLPRWQMVTLPAEPTVAPTSGGVPALQRQELDADAPHCETPSQMRKVTSGAFEGGKTLDDYYPDLVGKQHWDSNNMAGPFDNGVRAGSAVQLIGELPIPCATTVFPTTLRQTVHFIRAKVNGMLMAEGGKIVEGQTLDDIQHGGADQSSAPFRQTWPGVVSMADPITGVPYSQYNSMEFEADLTTSLTGAGGTVSVDWGVTIESSGGRVTTNKVW